MKKLVKILLVIAVLLIIILGGKYIYSQKESQEESPSPMDIPEQSPPEYIMYNQKRIIAEIDKQLIGLDLASIRKKANLILEKSIDEIQNSIKNGDLSYSELTAFYLDRIKQIDQSDRGINSISEINPNAMKQAKLLDQKKNVNMKPLFGMPITVKENINTKNMITSAGAYAFKDFIPNQDADIIKKFEKAESIILGKTSLSELACLMDFKSPDGFNNKHGQVVNPFNPLKISPSGSSSGSAASISSNIGVLSIGTDTNGSIIAPSSIESIVGFKPSLNSISTEGVFPLSSTLDSPGPIGKNVKDVIYAYNSLITKSENQLNLEQLDISALKGKTIGIIGENSPKVKELEESLKKLGVNVVNINNLSVDFNGLQIILNDFSNDFSAFTNKYNYPIKSLQELIDFNKEDVQARIKYGQWFLEEAVKVTSPDREFINSQMDLAKKTLNDLSKDKNLDAFVSIGAENSIIANVAGYPEITIPFGFNENKEPIGATFIGLENGDLELLKLAYSFEQQTKLRKVPNIK